MKKSTIIRRGRHCVFNLHVHLVFVAKYRRKVFTKKSLQDLREIFGDICHKMGVELIEFEGERDHVHLLIHYLPTHSISKIVNALKGASSRRIRKMGYKRINRALWGKSLWSPSILLDHVVGLLLKSFAHISKTKYLPLKRKYRSFVPKERYFAPYISALKDRVLRRS